MKLIRTFRGSACSAHPTRKSCRRYSCNGQCIQANKEKVIQWREANRARHNAKNRRWYAKNAKKAIATTRAWQKQHPEKVRATGRRWYKNNVARARYHYDKWAKANPAKVTALGMKRYAKKRAALPSTNNEKKLVAVYIKARKLKLEVDHVYPISLGGLHVPENLQLLTKIQNVRKGNKVSQSAEQRHKRLLRKYQSFLPQAYWSLHPKWKKWCKI